MLLDVLAVTVIISATAAVIVCNAERDVPGSNIKTLGDSLWWVATTATTVAYGDRFPVTTTGRLVAGVLMVTGIALVGTITASVAAYFVDLVRKSSTAATEEAASDDRPVFLARIEALQVSVDRLHQRLDGAVEPSTN